MSTFTRRRLLTTAMQTSVAMTVAPLIGRSALAARHATTALSSMRCINVMNFLRGVEPRNKVDLLLPVQEQMKLIATRRLPATWLLQFDALVDGPFIPFLRQTMPADHEVGFWFEMNQKLCDASGIAWRGRPGYEWDHYPDVAFTIGYTPEERIRLADAAMAGFKAVWGHFPKTVASWNLDSVTLAHLAAQYDIDAVGVCRDQIATDGFTIWGAPIAGYFPSKTNLWSPAVDPANQIHVPIFRLLGQDPVYYYDNQFRLDGQTVRQPDTMEPVWKSGRSNAFIDRFLHMIAEAPTLRFAYAQLGQENNFGWEQMAAAYPVQMDALVRLRDAGVVAVETMGDTGRRFKQAFKTTPPQAQVMLSDPFGNADPAERSVWYQSRFYRANLHLKGDLPYLRDLTVYSDAYPQPFLSAATRDREVHQRLPAVIDGFHWRNATATVGRPTAGGFLMVDGEPARLTGEPTVNEDGDALLVRWPIGQDRSIDLRFDERAIEMSVTAGRLSVAFEWDASRFARPDVGPKRVAYRWGDLTYAVTVVRGMARSTDLGWAVDADGASLKLNLDQS